MFTVSLIGPDGVGKTTIAKQMEETFPLPVKYLYMGVNVESSNYMLPTTRWWENRRKKRKPAKYITKDGNGDIQSSKSLTHHQIARSPHSISAQFRKTSCMSSLTGYARKVAVSVRKSLGFINRILEEWYRQTVAYSYSRRGYIVIFDRHFTFDFYHYDIPSEDGGRSITRKMHGFLAKHVFPKPDLVICLDAPGEVVFKRKGEFTPEILELKRTQYLSLKTVINNFAVVNADRDVELVIQDVSDLIYKFYQSCQ